MKLDLDLLKEMSILYAEDDSTVRESTAKTLSIFFKTVKTTNNGEDAIKIYEQMKPNIVILDIRMPLINGLEVASIIRQNDQHTPIIIATSYTENEDFLKAIKLNLADYIIKPFSFEQLRIALLEAIKKLEQNGLIYRMIGDGFHYDFTSKTIIKDDKTIPLTKSERLILEELLVAKGSIVTYERLEALLGLESNESKGSIKNNILRLRKKVSKELILNVQDFGYLLA